MKRAKLEAPTSSGSGGRLSSVTQVSSVVSSRKSIATAKRQPEVSRVGNGTSKRKSCPAPVARRVEELNPVIASAVAFVTPDRVGRVFEKPEDMTEVERNREIKRIIMCLSNFNKAQQNPIDSKTLTNLLVVLQSHVDAIDEDTWNIVVQTMQYAMSPRNCGSCFSNLEILVNEVLIHRPNYANAVANVLMPKFLRSANPKDVAPEDGPSISELKCFDVAAKLICRVVEVVGVKMLNRPLLNMMASSYPYVLKPPLTHFYYIRNLLNLNKMTGNSLTYSVLSVIIHKLTHMDSLISRDDIDSAPIQSVVLPKQEKSKSDNFIIKDEDTEELVVEILKSYSKIEAELAQTQQIATLDICLSYLISYLSSVHETVNFNSLLAIFEAEILPTFNTNCAQFIFFYLINLKEEYMHAFMNFLWKKFSNVSTPGVLRVQAVAYIAGVLARSTNVDTRTVRRWMSRLSSYAHEYLDSKSTQNPSHWSNVNVHAHGPFYAVCQAIFYTFVFRHFELVYGNSVHLKDEDKRSIKSIQALPPPSTTSFIYTLNLQRLITSDLNPLKACTPSVAKVFVTAAHAYQISYCKTVLERNNRASIRNLVFDNMRDVSSSSDDRAVNILNESFFPFDPLPLAYCKMIVDDSFRAYDGNSLALALVGEANGKSSEQQHESDGDCDDDLDIDCDDTVDGGVVLLACE